MKTLLNEFDTWEKKNAQRAWANEQERSGSCHIRSGYVCKECKKSVLSYKKPEKCEDHGKFTKDTEEY